MVYRSVSILAMLFVLWPSAVMAQHTGRRGSSTGASGGTASPEGADVETFKRAIAVQATAEQVTQFRAMAKSTETARQQARDLGRQTEDSGDSVQLTHKATSLQNSVDQVENDYQAFRRSLSDAQEAGLKEFTKKLNKAHAAVTKAAKVMSQQLDQVPVNAAKLPGAGESLEKALAAFQADQVKLGNEMGIPQQ